MSKNQSIRLHKEYGLNPTLSACIICGKETSEVALLGSLYKDRAPMHMITSIEPCQECREKYLTEGVLLVEATKNYKTMELTGNIAVITTESFSRIFNSSPVPKKHITYVEIGLLKRIGITNAVH